MPKLNTAEPDLITEFRLRRWARKNYLPREERRDETWHPAVLDEMRRKDAELEELELGCTVTSSYVPLAPGVHHTVHGGHREHSQSNLSVNSANVTSVYQV